MKTNKDVSALQGRALLRHSAVSWIQQCRNEGHSCGECLHRAAALAWDGRYYSARTLEEWYYAYRSAGFEALAGQPRSDSGKSRALDPQLAQRIAELRKTQPQLTVTAILERLRLEGILGAGNSSSCSRSTVYRFLQREGLDRQRLRALANEVGGPTKAWESEAPNALWMADVMDGPALKANQSKGASRTWLIATLDDHSRLVPHAQFYTDQKIVALLDCLRQAFNRRGLPQALYTDQGKIFVSHQLKMLCANLDIRLLHARPYAAWSKGKIERFFRSLQEGFLAALSFEPAIDLESLNRRLWVWLENTYHQRVHAALEGKTPFQRFQSVQMRSLPQDWQKLFYEQLVRRVRLDATVSLDGDFWEVPVHLRGRQVELRRDPFNPDQIEVWYHNQFCGVAKRCDRQLNYYLWRRSDDTEPNR